MHFVNYQELITRCWLSVFEVIPKNLSSFLQIQRLALKACVGVQPHPLVAWPLIVTFHYPPCSLAIYTPFPLHAHSVFPLWRLCCSLLYNVWQWTDIHEHSNRCLDVQRRRPSFWVHLSHLRLTLNDLETLKAFRQTYNALTCIFLSLRQLPKLLADTLVLWSWNDIIFEVKIDSGNRPVTKQLEHEC